jgi:hypothetical protein
VTRLAKKIPTCRKGCPNFYRLTIMQYDTCMIKSQTLECKLLPRKGVPRWCPLRAKKRRKP